MFREAAIFRESWKLRDGVIFDDIIPSFHSRPMFLNKQMCNEISFPLVYSRP